MKRMKKKIEKVFNAITFAEAGEHETALEYLGDGFPGTELLISQKSSSKRSGKDLLRKAEAELAGAAFAEAGEFDAAVEVLAAPLRPKAVLLVSEDVEAHPEAFNYALNLSRRIQATLEIVALTETRERDGSQETSWDHIRVRCAEQFGVPCSVSVLPGTENDSLIEYVRRHKEIAAVIYNSRIDKKKNRGFGILHMLEKIVERFSIPLVKVLTKQST